MRLADNSCNGEPLTIKLMSTMMDQDSGDGEYEPFSYDQDMNKTPHYKWTIDASKVLCVCYLT